MTVTTRLCPIYALKAVTVYLAQSSYNTESSLSATTGKA